jgi:nucleotide-binding universal stress UspA family protein
MYKHILIATDGSELATKGLEHGLALAEGLGAQVTVLTVVEPLDSDTIEAAINGGISDPVALYDRQIDERMKKRFGVTTQRASEHGVSTRLAHDAWDDPAEAIIEMAEKSNCDLIVMASHGRRGTARLLHGSRTAEVITHTSIPVLVVR